jgi:hypothetical protein
MNKSLRLSEKWFRRGLWVVAFAFALFLTGLGSTVVDDLPKVEGNISLEQFSDARALQRQRLIVEEASRRSTVAQAALEQAQLKQRSAESDTASAQETFNSWLSTRSVTQRSEQDPEVINRTRALESLRQIDRQALAAVERQEQVLLDAQQATQQAQSQMSEILEGGRQAFKAAQSAMELRVFLYRLALTLPLLAVAGYLFVKHRDGMYWPFVWGFIYFALMAFFVELVPYLPSWGAYVRYVVGIVITVIVGRYGIIALQNYLERQKQAELLPEALRRDELSYDVALGRLAKGVCPGCERPVDLKDVKLDFCPHCGIGLHDHCSACTSRKSTFSKFCFACGVPSGDRSGSAESGGASVAGPARNLGAGVNGIR